MDIVMVIGAPASGKSTFVAHSRSPGDCQVDIDLIHPSLPLEVRISIRGVLLRRAAAAPPGPVCWFQTSAPTRRQRNYWRHFVPIARTIILAPPVGEVLENQRRRALERPEAHSNPRSVASWYEDYEPPRRDEPSTCVIMEYPRMLRA